jgi:hypothetical protein
MSLLKFCYAYATTRGDYWNILWALIVIFFWLVTCCAPGFGWREGNIFSLQQLQPHFWMAKPNPKKTRKTKNHGVPWIFPLNWTEWLCQGISRFCRSPLHSDQMGLRSRLCQDLWLRRESATVFLWGFFGPKKIENCDPHCNIFRKQFLRIEHIFYYINVDISMYFHECQWVSDSLAVLTSNFAYFSQIDVPRESMISSLRLVSTPFPSNRFKATQCCWELRQWWF